MADYHEKEIKIEIGSLDAVKRSLKKAGARFIGDAFQRTFRFDTAKKELQKRGIYLRLRSGFDDVLTLKTKVENRNLKEREEIELHVDDIEKMRSILRALGFTNERIMEKRRSLWKLNNVDICLDELPFGRFVELEGEEKGIFRVAKKLGFDTAKKIIVSYWDLFESMGGKGNESIVFGASKT